MDSKINIRLGTPSYIFLVEAWSDETLTVALPGIDFTAAFPPPDPATSLVAMKNGKMVGQCSSQPVVRYWQHSQRIECQGLDSSTLAICKINSRVLEVEKRFLDERKQDPKKAMRSAGIAVIPRERGHGIGKAMRTRQIEVARENGMTTLFSETTNRYAADTITPFAPDLVAEFPYKDLARELNEPRLATIDDSFKIWCKEIS